jgi:hypothetical protein
LSALAVAVARGSPLGSAIISQRIAVLSHDVDYISLVIVVLTGPCSVASPESLYSCAITCIAVLIIIAVDARAWVYELGVARPADSSLRSVSGFASQAVSVAITISEMPILLALISAAKISSYITVIIRVSIPISIDASACCCVALLASTASFRRASVSAVIVAVAGDTIP